VIEKKVAAKECGALTKIKGINGWERPAFSCDISNLPDVGGKWFTMGPGYEKTATKVKVSAENGVVALPYRFNGKDKSAGWSFE